MGENAAAVELAQNSASANGTVFMWGCCYDGENETKIWYDETEDLVWHDNRSLAGSGKARRKSSTE